MGTPRKKMLHNYFTTALRYFLHQPIYSAINVSGLILGLTSSIFIFLWVLDEFSYDRYHPDNDRVYKVMWNHHFSDGRITTDRWTSGLLADALKSEIPEVEQTTRISWANITLFNYGEVINYEYGDYADPSIFETFNLTLLEGDKQNPLPNINSLAISKKLAEKYFKNEAVIGKTFRIDNTTDMTVTAVFDNLAENASETFEFILPFELYIKKESNTDGTWEGNGWQTTFVKLRDKKTVNQVNKKMADLVRKYEPPSTTPPPPPFLFAMTDWRLHDNFVNAKQSGGRINYIISFSLVAALILIIACINFMNLSTARSATRSREVGIRKVAGASRNSIIKQFLAESILISFLSLVVALLLVYLMLPLFNSFSEKHLSLDFSNPTFTFGIVGICLFTGLVAGSYPAFFLSSFKPASVLKGNLQSAFSGIRVRRAMVVFQFSLSIIIIACALVVNDQINYMQNKNLGFDKNNIISIKINPELYENYRVFRNELLQNQHIQSVAIGAAHPMEINGEGYYEWSGKSADDDVYFNSAYIDYDYLNTMGFTFIQGRNFSPDFPADSNNFIITEKAANYIGFADPIGQTLQIEEQKGQIIGVIQDFHNLNIHETMHPTVFTLGKGKEDFGIWSNIFIRYKDGSLSNTLDFVTERYKSNSSGFPIQYGFVDQDFEEQFKIERMISDLSLCFTILAVIISCLGLFGLASFSAERRAKEIGIRKVLGASVNGLVILLCKDFTRLVIYSIILGSPIAYYLMELFLREYPYHTQLGYPLVMIPAVTMLFISLAIISYQSIKAAIGNPVEILRSE